MDESNEKQSNEVERIRALWARVDLTDRPMLDDADGMEPGVGVTSLYSGGREALTLWWRTPEGRALVIDLPEQVAALLAEVDRLRAQLPAPAAVRAARVLAAEVIEEWVTRNDTLPEAGGRGAANVISDVLCDLARTYMHDGAEVDAATLAMVALRVDRATDRRTSMSRREETERVIAHVRAEVSPADQAQTLRDLKRGADGEPQLDESMLFRAAAEIDRETIGALTALVRRLRDGLRAWAREEDGVYELAWEAYADACVALGGPRPCIECGAPPCDPDCPLAAHECEIADAPDDAECAGVCDASKESDHE